MAEIIKILSLGISQSNFLGQLYGDLQEKYVNYKVAIDNFYDVSKGQVKNNENIFAEYFNFKKEKVSRYESIKSFVKLSFKKLFWEVYFFERSQGKSITESYYILRSFAYDKVITDKYILTAGYDIYHFHYCNPFNLRYIHHFPNNISIICSFWGSDLMRETGISNVFYVKKALKKAKVITIQNTELAEMLYCKYGREIQIKTSIIQFTIHTQIYDYIELMRNNPDKINKFKFDNNIPLEKIVIAISHNAFLANNHFKILESLEQLSSETKAKIVLILPLGYGRVPSYIESLEKYKNSSTIEMLFLHQFFGAENTALLRISTEIMIQMPISDALSGAMTEVLYAGNHVITGGWLPYGLLRRNKINYSEIESYKVLPLEVEELVNNLKVYKEKNVNNARNIKETLFPHKTTAAWHSLFSNIS